MKKREFYKPKGKLMWDLWFLKEKNYYHVFYLQHKEIVASENRHDNVSIGHAISKNLLKWKELPTALNPGKKGEWDNLALWTGSVIKKNNQYYLFYTGRNSKKGQKWTQKIGLAISNNLINWTKYKNNPILETDGKYYSDYKKENKLKKIPAFRDPDVFKDPRSKRYYMFFCARENTREKVFNGCIGAAESNDLINWKLKKPVLAPKRYDEMECPQLIYHKGFYYLFFLVPWETCYEPNWAEYFGRYPGLHCYYSKKLFGKYKPVNGSSVVLSNGRRIYGTRLLEKSGDTFTTIGWLNFNDQGDFIGKMSHPFDIIIKGDLVYPVLHK